MKRSRTQQAQTTHESPEASKKKSRINPASNGACPKIPSHKPKLALSASKGNRSKVESNSNINTSEASNQSNRETKKYPSAKVLSGTASCSLQPESITIVIGTYEHILFGLNLSFPPSEPALFTTLFHFVAHPSPITVLALPSNPSPNPILTSSSVDSQLTLWSLSKRRCIGTLSSGMLAADSGGAGREPGVKTARFDRSGKILVVGDETGGMSVYRTRDWALVRKFAGSGKGRVNDLAIEPQKGRIMLSVGQDRCLRMWDLGGGKDKGKPMASVRLGTEAERLEWSSSGKKLAVITGPIVTVYDTMMTPLFTFTSPRGRVHDVKFLIDGRSEEYLILACDDSVGRIFRLGHSTINSETEPQCVAELLGHSNRVKCVEIVSLRNGQDRTLAVTISSDGLCHVYELVTEQWDDVPNSVGLEPIAKHDTGKCRLTCLAVVGVLSPQNSTVVKDAEEVGHGTSEDGEELSGIDLDANGEQLMFEDSDDYSSEASDG